MHISFDQGDYVLVPAIYYIETYLTTINEARFTTSEQSPEMVRVLSSVDTPLTKYCTDYSPIG